MTLGPWKREDAVLVNGNCRRGGGIDFEEGGGKLWGQRQVSYSFSQCSVQFSH